MQITLWFAFLEHQHKSNCANYPQLKRECLQVELLDFVNWKETWLYQQESCQLKQ